MTPKYCGFHKHWTDGDCYTGKRELTRHDVTQRLADIDFMLADNEGAASRGYYANKSLEGERAMLLAMRQAIS